MIENTNEGKNEFVDIHGRDISVFVDDSGEIFVPLSEIKKTGFSIYRKTQYNKLLIDDSQFTKEFTLYLLEASKTYMLNNRIKFAEDEMIASINNCKKLLMGEGSSICKSTSADRIVQEKGDSFSIKIQNERLSPKPQQFGTNKRFNTGTSPQIPPIPQRISSPSYMNHQSDLSEKLQAKTEPKFINTENKQQNNYVPRKFPYQPSASAEKKTANDVAKSVDLNLPVRLSNLMTTEKMQKQIPVVELNDTEHKVLVSFVGKNKSIWVQDLKNISTLNEIFSKLVDFADTAAIVSDLKLNNFYIAEEDGIWFRCRLISINPMTVFFLDYGNSSQVKEVRAFPKELASIPCQAINVCFQESIDIKEEEELTIIPLNKQENGVYLVKIKEDKPVEPPTFFTLPPCPYVLKDKIKVMVKRVENGALILNTRESFEKSKEIQTMLKNIKTEMVRSVKVGQLVVCKKNESNSVYRASVVSINGTDISVKYLENGELETVQLSSIQHITEQLAAEPITYITSPPVAAFKNRLLSPKSLEFLQNLIKDQSKCVVIFPDPDRFDLSINDKLLSSILEAIENPEKRTMLIDMKKLKPNLGVSSYMIYYHGKIDAVTLIPIEQLEKLTYVITAFDDPEAYKPVEGEVCWGQFEGDWYRCVVKRIVGDKFDISFVDFGNTIMLTSDQIRKLSDSVKEIPVLGIPAQLVNYPQVPNIDLMFKELITDSDTYDVNIKSFDGNRYNIELPTLYEVIQEAAI